jgi:hypothetical protein
MEECEAINEQQKGPWLVTQPGFKAFPWTGATRLRIGLNRLLVVLVSIAKIMRQSA